MPENVPRCEATPLPGHQVSFRIDGSERTRWHFGSQHPRPFFYPLRGPSGSELTRMGHPGAPNHDHHLSIWFAHHKVSGVNFWADTSPAVIRQSQWLAYEDGDDEALMAVRLHWHDGHDPRELLQQQLVVSVRPAPDASQETLLEVDTVFTPVAEMLEFGQTNFGFFAVRVARSLSAHFGGGQLTGDSGRQGEPELFGKRSRWMDYSGPVRVAGGATPEGITFFDHPANPGHPAHWHVRADGWMGAAACLAEPRLTTRQAPLRLRYLLHAHGGDFDPGRAEAVWQQFRGTPGFQLRSGREAGVAHRQFVVRRGPS